MSPWDSFVEALDRAHGHVDRIGLQTLRVVVEVEPGRLQEVYLTPVQDHRGHYWAQLDAPVARLSQVDLHRAVRAVERAVCGGLCHLGIGGIAHVSVRQSLLLVDSGQVLHPTVDAVLGLLAVTASGLADELL